jgi:hypothetical protein
LRRGAQQSQQLTPSRIRFVRAHIQALLRLKIKAKKEKKAAPAKLSSSNKNYVSIYSDKTEKHGSARDLLRQLKFELGSGKVRVGKGIHLEESEGCVIPSSTASDKCSRNILRVSSRHSSQASKTHTGLNGMFARLMDPKKFQLVREGAIKANFIIIICI